MGFVGIILIIVALVALISIFYISVFNKLQYARTKIEHVESLIDEDLRSKFDLVKRSDDVIKNNVKTKSDYLKEYTEIESNSISNFDLERKLNEAEGLIKNIFNDEKGLNDNENAKEILQGFREIDEKLDASIGYYNTQMNSLNSFIRRFPHNIIAKLHGFKVKPFFDGKDMTDDIVTDFKL